MKKSLYETNAELTETYSDEIDALEVMIEMLGYRIGVDTLIGYSRVFFFKNDSIQFYLTFYEYGGCTFNASSTEALNKVRQLGIVSVSSIQWLDLLLIANDLLDPSI